MPSKIQPTKPQELPSPSKESTIRGQSMADQDVAEPWGLSAWPPLTSLLLRAMRKRRTWAALFLAVYASLLCSSWRLVESVRAWYYSAAGGAGAVAAWPAALYASVMYGAVFGLLSMGAALAVAAPAMLITWITVLVLLAFAGKPRRSLVAEGRRATADIARLALRVLLREGNAVAALCAAASFAALLLGRRDDDPAEGSGS